METPNEALPSNSHLWMLFLYREEVFFSQTISILDKETSYS